MIAAGLWAAGEQPSDAAAHAGSGCGWLCRPPQLALQAAGCAPRFPAATVWARRQRPAAALGRTRACIPGTGRAGVAARPRLPRECRPRTNPPGRQRKRLDLRGPQHPRNPRRPYLPARVWQIEACNARNPKSDTTTWNTGAAFDESLSRPNSQSKERLSSSCAGNRG
jgi:hypothetical protein